MSHGITSGDFDGKVSYDISLRDFDGSMSSDIALRDFGGNCRVTLPSEILPETCHVTGGGEKGVLALSRGVAIHVELLSHDIALRDICYVIWREHLT